MIKKFSLVILLVSFCSNFLFSQENDLKSNSDWYIYSNANKKYESDKTINIYLSVKNIADSLLKKYNKDFKWEIIDKPATMKFYPDQKLLSWSKFFIVTGDIRVKVALSNQYKTDTLTIDFTVEEAWKTYLIPGASYSTYTPANSDLYGSFNGFAIEYLIYGGINRNENKGPSHIKVYAKLDLLFSNKDTISEAFITSVGINLSFERNPTRKYMIPFFGIELSSLYQKNIGTIGAYTPTFGVWLYSDQNIMAYTSAGYLYPSDRLEELRGTRFAAGVNISFW